MGVLNDSCFCNREALLPPDGFADVITFRELLPNPVAPFLRKVLRELNSVDMTVEIDKQQAQLCMYVY